MAEKKVRPESQVLAVRPVDDEFQTVSFQREERDTEAYCRQPCPQCPWRKDTVGVFPPEAFRHSAVTAQDMSSHQFACHSAGLEKPLTCAGFLLSESANHNLSVRLSRMKRRGLEEVSAAGLELFSTYRAMAEANGVDRDDPALRGTR